MKWNRGSGIILMILVIIAALGIGQTVLLKAAPPQILNPVTRAPIFEVDPYWPKMEGHFGVEGNWMMGGVAGNAVDLTNDHVWVLTRPGTLGDDENPNPPTWSETAPTHDRAPDRYAKLADFINAPIDRGADCCVPAPAVLEFDSEGNFIQGWGGAGPGHKWVGPEHGMFVDYRGNVWISGSAKTVMKFTKTGEFLLQIGHEKPDVYSDDTESLNQPNQVWVYPKTNEVFIADGYVNRRVIVFDADTGKFKRFWGAYGNKPDDWAPWTRIFEGPAPAQFDVVHTIAVSNDGLVYVGDRNNNRIQVFNIDGTFVKEAFVARTVRNPSGTVAGLAFSADDRQQFLYVAGSDAHLRILDRDSLQVVGSFGRYGHYPGQFLHLHTIAVDSKGNIYTADAGRDGRRIQKFLFKGISRSPVQ